MRARNTKSRHRRAKKIFEMAQGYRGGRRRLFRTARESVERAERYRSRDRRTRKRHFRRLWITRITAACRARDLSYSRFICGLDRAGYPVDRKVISELAIHDPAAFDELVKLAREGLAASAPAPAT